MHLKKYPLLFIFFLPALLHAQDYDSLMRSMNYIPDLIRKNTPWENILDSIRLNYPDKTVEITEVKTTCRIIKDPDAGKKYPPEMFVFFQHPRQSPEYRAARETILRKGRQYLPQLINMLKTDAATRIIIDWDDHDYPGNYLTISDLAMDLIEQVSGIWFYRDFVQSHRFFSKEDSIEKEKTIGVIGKWYTKSQLLSKTAAINFYLDSLPPLSGSRIYTIENLAKMGDTLSAVRHLSTEYHKLDLPCRSNMLVANMLLKWGVDIATEDCMSKVLNYRCMHENGVECVWYLLKNPQSGMGYDVLAEVVSTERYSRYKNLPYNNHFIWHTIFNEMAVTKSLYSKPILLELLKIKDPVKGSEIAGSYWRSKYPEQYGADYRVCDFALLKMQELKMTDAEVDWSGPETRDATIIKITEKK